MPELDFKKLEQEVEEIEQEALAQEQEEQKPTLSPTKQKMAELRYMQKMTQQIEDKYQAVGSDALTQMLHILKTEQPISQEELTKLLGINKSALFARMARMSKRGWIARVRGTHKQGNIYYLSYLGWLKATEN